MENKLTAGLVSAVCFFGKFVDMEGLLWYLLGGIGGHFGLQLRRPLPGLWLIIAILRSGRL